jgi:hypothetical protein
MSHAGALDRLLIMPSEQIGGQHQISHALASASAAIARLDQALSGHPLRQAFLFRARLDAVRRQAATDGARIDPWHLAASVEGLKFRVDPYLRIAERGIIFDAARTALNLHQWLTETDFDQECEVQKAEAELALHVPALPPLLAAAKGFWTWIDRDQPRAAMRAALVRFWSRHNLLCGRWNAKRSTSWICYSRWNAPGMTPGVRSPAGAVPPMPRRPSMCWPRR